MNSIRTPGNGKFFNIIINYWKLIIIDYNAISLMFLD